MVKNKSLCGKITIISIMIIMTLILAFSSILLSNNVYAEEANTVSDRATNTEYSVYGSAYFDILANGGHNIGTVRLNVRSAIKESGDGMILAEVQVAPRVNDGSHDYKVVQFSLNMGYGDDKGSVKVTGIQDNSEKAIVTSGSSGGLVVKNDGIEFEVGSSFSTQSGKGSVQASINDKESLPDQYDIQKFVHVPVSNPTKDTTINYQIAIFFKAEPKDFSIFYVEMFDLQVDGIFLAPDYGVNNSENIFLWGMFITENKEFGLENSSGHQAGEKDGSPNDTLSLKSFDWDTYVN